MATQQEDRFQYFERRLSEIESKCTDAARQIKEGLYRGEKQPLPNNIILAIENEIFQLLDQAEPRSNGIITTRVQERVVKELIKNYKNRLDEFIEQTFNKINECSNEKEIILEQVSQTYRVYKAFSFQLKKIFLRLESYTYYTDITTLHSTSFKLLKDRYFLKNKQIILNTILQFIQEARQNKIILNKKIKQLIDLFSIMGSKEVGLKYHQDTGCYDYFRKMQYDALEYYEKEFEFPLLQSVNIYAIKTIIYYKTEINKKFKFKLANFIDWGNSILEFEEEMAKDCYPQSERQIEKELINLFVQDQAEKLVTQDRSIALMLQFHQMEELKNLYNYIAKKKECIHFIAKAYQTYFEQQVAINMASQSDGHSEGDHLGGIFVSDDFPSESLPEIKRKAEQILKNQFQDDPEIRESFNVVFDKFLNMQKPVQQE